jgi:hypothetical protein
MLTMNKIFCICIRITKLHISNIANTLNVLLYKANISGNTFMSFIIMGNNIYQLQMITVIYW